MMTERQAHDTAKTAKIPLALVFHHEVQRKQREWEHDRTLHCLVYPVRITGYHKVENLYGVEHKWLIDGLQCDTYGWDARVPNAGDLRPEYRESKSSSVAVLQRMARTLKAIGAAMDKLRERFGYPATYGAAVARLADVLGAEYVLLARRPNNTSHDEADYEWVTPGDAVWKIDCILADWAKPLTPTVMLYTTAPAAYDGFGTETTDPDVGTVDDKALRTVVVQREHLEWQVSRYRSGMHYASEERPESMTSVTA